MQHTNKRRLLPCAVLLATLLSGCGNMSKIDDQGVTASPVWPDMKDMTLPGGTHPDLNQLRMVKAGMTKDQLYHLLGRPHFLEGFLFVREWDYLFHIETPEGEQACRYKVLFDRDRLARSFHWNPESCAAAVAGATDSRGG